MTQPSYLIVVKSQSDSDFKISGWETDLIEATHQADQLVQRPYLAHAAQVYQITGSCAVPEFLLKYSAGYRDRG